MGHDTFQAGDLTAVIGDNEAYGDHRAGYNGIHRLTHRTEPTLFVPAVAGMNFEHIFDGEQGIQGQGNNDIFFEPRRAPMSFTRISDLEAELHQEPTPTFHLESWTRFKMAPPHSVDFWFRFKPHQHAFRYDYVGLFWASYINAPEDKSIYFRGGNSCQQFCTQEHDLNSTVIHKDDSFQLTASPDSRPTLFKSLSPLRYDEPFYYGHFRNHVLILMFDRSEFILPTYEVLKEYGIRARVVYRERVSRAEIVKEYESWRASLGKG